MPDRRPPTRFGPLERRLFLIVLGAVLPLVVFSYLILTQNAGRQRAHLIDAAQNTMHATMAAVDAELQSIVSSLDVLGASPRLQGGDLGGFRTEALDLLARRGWANLVLSTPDARQILNLRIAPGAPLPGGVDPRGVAAAARLRQPVVGSIVYSPVLEGYYFSVKLPILRGERVLYVLSAVLAPDTVQRLILQQSLPPEGVVGVFDGPLNIVARSMHPELAVGRPISPSFRQLLARDARPAGWARTRTLEGRAVYTVFQRSALSGWTAGVGLPVEYIDGPVQRSYRLLGVGIVLSVALGFAVAFLVARRIVRPVQELEAAAQRMGHGSEPAAPATDIPQIRQAGEALHAAWRERERHLEEERVLRTQAEQARRMAEHANEAKDEFLAMLGHELRNPLAPIYSAIQLLQRTGADPERVRKMLPVMLRQTEHLIRLVNDLLDVSRVTRRLITLQRERLDLNTLLPDALEQVQDLVERHRHTLEVGVAPEPVWVDADRTRMTQVIVNLLQNAAKFTPDAGRIRLLVEGTPQWARLTVSDNGQGMDAQLLPQVFDLFKQAEHGIDRKLGGLGIGLSLTKGLVELHGGTVSAHSDGPGRGSTFTVELPRVAPAAARGAT